MKRTSLLVVSLTAACLCASQAGVSGSSFEHLFEGTPLIVGTKGAWIVGEPRVVSVGQNGIMVFGPNTDEAVIAVSERRAGNLSLPTSENGAQSAQSAGEGIFVVNLVSGARRQILAPIKGFKFSSILWVSRRIIMADGSGPDWQGSILIDALTGNSFSLDSSSTKGLIVSEVPNFAVLRDTSEKTSTGATRVQIEVIDFSSTPPVKREFETSLQAINSFVYTKDHTIICRAGRDSFVELSLSTGESKPWKGDQARLFLTEEGNLPDQSLPPRDISATIRSGKDGGLWVGENLYMPAMTASVGRQTHKPASLRPMIRISKDSDFALMDGWGQKVLFRSLGTAYVLDLKKIDLEAAVKALMEAAKAKAMNYAKEAAIGGLIYASDYDNYLPISGAQARDAVNPYVKSIEILDTVIWTNVSGQNMDKIQNPATYELGYVPGPGGRAIIYADGHVGWRADP